MSLPSWCTRYTTPFYLFLIALLIRLVMIGVGEWQDRHMVVKFTDIDYFVYTDAARYVWEENSSPYQRQTYRYTPALAFLLIPNCYTMLFGKVIFLLCDLVAGWLIWKIGVMLEKTRDAPSSISPLTCTALFLLNPLILTVSTRGNADILITTMVLATLYLLLIHHITWSAIWYGICVHFKIYPIIYAPAIWLFINRAYVDNTPTHHVTIKNVQVQASTSTSTSTPSLLTRFITYLRSPQFRQQVYFGLVSFFTFTALTSFCYALYGYEFLYETYFYHLIRRDHRHNFALYFYQLYLQFESPSTYMGLITFIPQFTLILLIAFQFHQDLPFTMLLQTWIFVHYNKVITAQYFVWYVALLPLIIPASKMSGKRALLNVGAWFVTEVHWLTWAYRLEFLGENTFMQIFFASILFFLVNCWLMCDIIRHHHFAPCFRETNHIKKQ